MCGDEGVHVQCVHMLSLCADERVHCRMKDAESQTELLPIPGM